MKTLEIALNSARSGQKSLAILHGDCRGDVLLRLGQALGAEQLPVHSLALIGVQCDDGTADALCALLQLKTPAFVSILLESCNIAPHAIRKVINGLALSQTIREFRCRGAPVGDQGAVLLLEATKSGAPMLHSISLSRANISLHGVQYIADAIQDCWLKITLSQNHIGDEGVRLLANALHSGSSLAVLNLAECGIGPRGCEHLAHILQTCPAMRELDIEGNHIGCSGVELVSKALDEARALESLRLVRCDVRGRGVQCLAAALATGAPALQELGLFGNPLPRSQRDLLQSALASRNNTLYVGFDTENEGANDGPHEVSLRSQAAGDTGRSELIHDLFAPDAHEPVARSAASAEHAASHLLAPVQCPFDTASAHRARRNDSDNEMGPKVESELGMPGPPASPRQTALCEVASVLAVNRALAESDAGTVAIQNMVLTSGAAGRLARGMFQRLHATACSSNRETCGPQGSICAIGCEFAPGALPALARELKVLPLCKELSFIQCGITESSAGDLALLASHTIALTLTDNHIGDNTVMALADAIRQGIKLQTLALSSLHISDHAAEELIASLAAPASNVRKISLSSPCISPQRTGQSMLRLVSMHASITEAALDMGERDPALYSERIMLLARANNVGHPDAKRHIGRLQWRDMSLEDAIIEACRLEQCRRAWHAACNRLGGVPLPESLEDRVWDAAYPIVDEHFLE